MVFIGRAPFDFAQGKEALPFHRKRYPKPNGGFAARIFGGYSVPCRYKETADAIFGDAKKPNTGGRIPLGSARDKPAVQELLRGGRRIARRRLRTARTQTRPHAAGETAQG